MKKLMVALALAGFIFNLTAEEAAPKIEKFPHWIYPVRDSVTSLDGEWDFKLESRAHDGKVDPRKGMCPARMERDWKCTIRKSEGKIKVPANWETEGYKYQQYGNQCEDLIGTYSRTFAYDPSWNGRKVILRLDGVAYGYDAWVNGVQVAKGVTSAYNLHQFDITAALKDGANEIVIAVNTRAPGWLWDTNDCWCMTGIFRPVEIFTVPADGWIEDVTFVSKANGECEVKVACGGERTDRNAEVKLIDAEGKIVFAGAPGGFKVASPKLWSDETPYLYTLEVAYNGMRVREKVGIREVTSDAKHIYINGKPMKFRGVCWNEIMPKLGRAITREARREQMERMKKCGINYIRTAHYPFGVDFYELADEMGFYVVDEIPFGSRGSGLLRDAKNEPLLIDRTERTIRRDKNHPSIFMWTFGNENHVRANTIAVLKYAKSKDPTRLRCLPQTWEALAEEPKENTDTEFEPWVKSPHNELVQVFSGHYFDPERLAYCAKLPKPFFQTEFSHACGNGMSQFEDRWPRILATENFAGGSVWMWQDQAVETDGEIPFGYMADGSPMVKSDYQKDAVRKTTKDVQGVWVDDRTFWDSYGDRGTDGICYADGTPKESYYLIQKYYLAYPSLPTRVRPAIDQLPIGQSVNRSIDQFLLSPSNLLLRVGRAQSLLPQTQKIGKSRDFLDWADPYILHPVVQKRQKDGSCKVRYFKFDDPKSKQFVDAVVKISGGEVSYTITPNEKCKGVFFELGLMLDVPQPVNSQSVNRLIGQSVNSLLWSGLGPYRSYPGKTMMNDYGVFSLAEDDMYFIGNRMDTDWAVIGDTMISNVDGSPFNLVTDIVDGKVLVGKNEICLAIGGKSQRPGASAGDTFVFAPVTGSFRLARVDESSIEKSTNRRIEKFSSRPFKSTYGL